VTDGVGNHKFCTCCGVVYADGDDISPLCDDCVEAGCIASASNLGFPCYAEALAERARSRP
jgi:hypothetical protein